MKHLPLIATIFTAFLYASPVNGQSPLKIRLGTQATTMFGDTYQNLGFRTGLVAGFGTEIDLENDLSLLLELNFSAEGARNRNYDFSSFSTVIYDQKLQYNYLQLPLLLQYPLNNGLILTVGPQFGFRLSARETRIIKSGTPAPTDNSAGTRTFNQRIKFIYPNFVLGASYPLNAQLEAQARVQLSPLDNVKRKAGDSEGTYPLNFQLALAFQIR